MTGAGKNEYIFTWKIENFLSCYQEKGEHIESPTFTVESLSDSLWCLWFYPKGDPRVKKEESFFSCFLLWKSSSGIIETPSIDFSIEIVDSVDSVLKCLKTNHVFTVDSSQWGWVRALAIGNLLKEMHNWEEDTLTVRCRIKCDKFKKQNISGSEACTSIDVDRRYFEWDVQTPVLFEHTESALFQISDMYKFEIILASLLGGLDVSIQLKEYREDLSNKPVRFRLIFCDNEGSEIISTCIEHSFQHAERWKFPDFITKNFLETCNQDSGRYAFKLKCEIYVSMRAVSFNSIEKVYFKSSAFYYPGAVVKACSNTAMQNDFRSLFENRKYSDVTVRAGNEEFFVHRLVLSARSPVFEAMFDQDMLENETGIINVIDVEGSTMKTFLKFLYTETVDEMDCESANKLMIAADKYQVQSLVNECVSFLKSIMSVENACEITAVADSINCESLRSHAIRFVVSNAGKILVTPNWTKWINENTQLASDILSKLSVDLMRSYK